MYSPHTHFHLQMSRDHHQRTLSSPKLLQVQVSTLAADWRLEHVIRISALISEGVIEFVIGRDVLVCPGVMGAPHSGAGVEKLAETVYQHLGNTMLLTSACVWLLTMLPRPPAEVPPNTIFWAGLCPTSLEMASLTSLRPRY